MTDKTAIAVCTFITAIIYGSLMLIPISEPPSAPEPEPSLPPPPTATSTGATSTEPVEERVEEEREAENLPDGVICTDDCPLIEVKTREYFADIPVMIAIARCESTFRHYDENGEVLKSHYGTEDYGVMQINTRYHQKTAEKMGLDVKIFEDNLAYARYLYETQGTRPWSVSAPCWSS